MLETLRSGPGFRIAMALAFFAALCFMAPPAAMAFGHGSNAVHCLSHADAKDHGMPGGMVHQKHGAGHEEHGDHAQLPSGKAPGCCGLFCLSALMPANGPFITVLKVTQALSPRFEARLSSRIPELPDRPPISSLSV